MLPNLKPIEGAEASSFLVVEAAKLKGLAAGAGAESALGGSADEPNLKVEVAGEAG